MDYDGAPLTWTVVGHIDPSDLRLNQPEYSWLQMPTPALLDDSRVRVFFAARKGNRPYLRYLDLNIVHGHLAALGSFGPSKPLIEPGTRHWDRDGIYPSCVVPTASGFLLYTVGWVLGQIAPMFTARIGLAHLDKDANLISYEPEPILDLTINDPFLVTSPCVRRVENGLEMLYTSGDAWLATSDGPDSRYSIRWASSSDGLSWNHRGKVAVALPYEYTHIARPAFLSNYSDDILVSVTTTASPYYELRICAKIGFNKWVLKGPFQAISTQRDTVAAYPAVLKRQDDTLLFINGKDRGRLGFTILRQEH